uniref:Uncharacterized protein n=1 Tax=Thermosporothrix sp. COM3 TaxID=2490863 RepID=A0A455STK5_9CHLR|nr:hypothetical protein KTC_32250 [Thermosporothrix sp. COM3]
MIQRDEISPATDALERLPRTSGQRNAIITRKASGRLKQTDALPYYGSDGPGTRAAWKQVAQLREENRHLRTLLEEQRTTYQQLQEEHTTLKAEFENQLAQLHNGYQQELEYYQQHLHEATTERQRLQETVELHTQELQTTAQEEARKLIAAATQELARSPENPPELLQEVKATIEAQIKQQEEKHLVELLLLKREVQHMADVLDKERKQLAEEQKRVLTLQRSSREQAHLRQRLLEQRIKTRWKVTSLLTTIVFLFCMIAFQFLFLLLFHIPLTAGISFALLTPILLCILGVFALNGPLATAWTIYTGAPHKKKVQE